MHFSNQLVLSYFSESWSYYNLSFTDVRTSSSRPFTGQPGPNLVGRWRVRAEVSLRYWFPWQSNCCYGIQQRPSCGSYIWMIVTNFSISGRLAYTDLPTKNEHILPCGSRDRPIATCLTTILWSVTVPMHGAWRHHARRVACNVRQIGVGVLSMPNFEFFKSDQD